MSQVIDEKVVEMKFDNSNFESNVKESLSTLEKLKQSLDLSESAKTFESVSKEAGKVSFDGLSEGIEAVKVKFSAFEVMATTALANITSSAVDAGMAMVKSFSTDLISSGFNQYEEKTKAVQTIMNATGESVDAVNSRLDKLIWYSDETSYSFSDMVNNVGKFTAAGVDIDKATNAMIGISNWAAVSGAGKAEASQAMYNLSQAMSIGHVLATDWRSIEIANMATAEFKQQVVDTAISMGKLTAEGKTLGKGTQVTAEGLRDSLIEGWFDNDVLIEVLGKYSDFTNKVYDEVQESGENCARAMETVAEEMAGSYDEIGRKSLIAAQEAKTFTEAVEATKEAVKSQWGTMFESVFGDYDQARVLFTNLSNTLWDIFAGPLSDVNDVIAEALSPETISGKDWNNILTDLHKSIGVTDKDLGVFEKAVMTTARKNGVAIDDIMAKYDSFRDSLQEGWLTSDIIDETV